MASVQVRHVCQIIEAKGGGMTLTEEQSEALRPIRRSLQIRDKDRAAMVDVVDAAEALLESITTPDPECDGPFEVSRLALWELDEAMDRLRKTRGEDP